MIQIARKTASISSNLGSGMLAGSTTPPGLAAMPVADAVRSPVT